VDIANYIPRFKKTSKSNACGMQNPLYVWGGLNPSSGNGEPHQSMKSNKTFPLQCNCKASLLCFVC